MIAPRILLSVLAGLGIGAPIAKVGDGSYESPYDPMRTNAFYDLAVLYGDANGDGHVDEDEYLSFDIDSISPSNKVGEEQDFRYLATLPYDVGEIYVYVFSADRMDDCALKEDSSVTDYDSCTWSYTLAYRNSAEENADGTGYEDDSVRQSSLDMVNFYHGVKGWYYKFRVEGYSPRRSSDGTYRIKPVALQARDGDYVQREEWDFGDGNEWEIHYDDDVASENAPFLFFQEDTYEMRAEMDVWIAPTGSKVFNDKTYWFWPWKNTEAEDVSSAKEIFYVFFDFVDGDFTPDEIKRVSWTCNVATYGATNYAYSSGGPGYQNTASRSIYDGTVRDFPEYTIGFNGNDGFKSYTSSIRETGERRRLSGTTEGGDIESVYERFDSSILWKHETIKKTYLWPSIVDVSEVPKDFDAEDEVQKPFVEFMSEADHAEFDWAYAIADDSLVRTREWRQVDGTMAGQTWTELDEVVTTMHEVEDVVTLGMTVVEDGKEFDIRTVHDPLTVRYAFMIGAEPPTLIDFIINDIQVLIQNIVDGITDFFRQFWWVAILVGLVVVAVLAALFRPVLDVLKFIGKGILFVFKLAVDAVYLVLVWWWLALIRKARGEDAPPIWIFGKKE